MNKLIKLRNQLLADKQKLGVMLTLCLVALLLWGRLLMKNVPRTAVADPDQAIAAAVHPTPGLHRATADKPTKAAVVVPTYTLSDRDLFDFNPMHYGLSDQAETGDKPLAKLEPEKTDEKETERQKRMAVQAAAQQLTLQSTLLGNVHRAMINGVLLEPGEKILGFELTKVQSRQVTLVLDGIEVTLEM